MGTFNVTNGNWLNPIEEAFQTNQPLLLGPNDVALVPLASGRILHDFSFFFRDPRPRSQLMLQITRYNFLPGTWWGSWISVQDYLTQVRQHYFSNWNVPQTVDDKYLLEWGVQVGALLQIDGKAKIVNGLYMDADISDAAGNVVLNWKKKFIEPNIYGNYGEEDHVWENIPLAGLYVQPGWHMRFQAVFPTSGPSTTAVPLKNLLATYHPQNATEQAVRAQNAPWYQPSGGISIPASANGKTLVAVIIELHDNHGGAQVYLHKGDNVPVTSSEDIKGDRNIRGERQMFYIEKPWVVQPGDRIYLGGASFGSAKGQIEVREVDIFVSNQTTTPVTPGGQSNLTSLGAIRVDNPAGEDRQIQLLQGDLSNLGPGDAVDYVVVSAYPNSYGASGLIGALANKGVSLQQLSYSPALDRRPQGIPCWISQPLNNPSFHGRHIVVYEPTGNDPIEKVRHIENIYATIKAFHGAAPASIAVPLVCTGSGGADYQLVTRMLACKALTYAGLSGFSLQRVKIVNYSQSTQAVVLSVFNQIKETYERLGNQFKPAPNLPNSSSYAKSDQDAKGTVTSKGLNFPTPKQAYAIALYTTSYYRPINSPLYSSASAPKPNLADANYIALQPYYALLDAALSNVAPYIGITYRGVTLPDSSYLIQSYKNLPVPFTNYNYLSSSTQQHVGINFSGGKNLLDIDGQSGRDIKQYSLYNEDEVLFPRETTLRTLEYHPGPGVQNEFRMREIPRVV